MGVKGIFQALSKLEAYDIQQKPSPIHQIQVGNAIITVDVLGSFYDSLSSSDLQNLDKWAHFIKRTFAPLDTESIVFFVDGALSDQNSKEHRIRNNVLTRRLERLQKSVQKFKEKSSQATKATHRDILRHYKAAFCLGITEKKAIADSLERAGLLVVRDIGEADVAIGRTGMPTVVISHDSDLLVYDNTVELWKPVFYHRQLHFKKLNRENILTKLGLSSSQFQALCVVSANDYNESLRGHGFLKNYKFIKYDFYFQLIGSSKLIC